MNRTIKFRGWDQNTKEMFEVGNIDFNKVSHDGQEWFHRVGEGYTDLRHTDHVILMQFTGFTDKNGKEIYEGDFVSIWGAKPVEVKWSDSITNCGECTEVQATGFDLEEFCTGEEREVIGNIYENPNLLAT